MKKKLVLALATLTAAFLLTSCAKGTGNATKSSKTTGEKTITFQVYGKEDTEPTSVFMRSKKWANDFNKRYKGKIKVKVTGQREPQDTLTAISASSTPDIFNNFWNNTPQWASSHAILDLTDYIKKSKIFNKSDYLPYSLKMCSTPEGVQYAVPTYTESSVLIYNEDVLKDAGYNEPPKTLDELVEMNKKISIIKNGKIERAGFIPNQPWLDNVAWPVATGAEWVDGKGNVTFNTDKMKKAYSVQVDLLNDLGGYKNVETFVSSIGKIQEASDPVLNGKIGMMLVPDGWLASYNKYGKNVNWKVAPFPSDTGENMITIGTYCINAKTKNPDEAWTALEDYSSEKSIKKFFLGGDFNNGAIFARKSAINALANDEQYPEQIRTVAKDLETEKLRGFAITSYTNEYLDEITKQMSDALAGRQTVDQAAEKIQKNIEKVAKK
ncbi:ABC transporter substrate-binding protein [Lapidilactobacillus achengensis]|uniref:ABC transporter substrate-binding protein n=1 Tax=Lapidilactobacillus achengensis TaxID=2486000 RepID=A0ABW1UN61_9LACO|nr:extracellular solute-binding protein [Lapidilactobacillus achengensis]